VAGKGLYSATSADIHFIEDQLQQLLRHKGRQNKAKQKAKEARSNEQNKAS